MDDDIIEYQHPSDPNTWFRQYACDPVPVWAVNVRDAENDAAYYARLTLAELPDPVSEWLDDMAEFNGTGKYDKDGNWVWADED